MRLPPMPSSAELLRLYRVSARKQLSQNFLLNSHICDKFARAGGPLSGSHVLEVGPGPGALTRSLLNAGAQRVVAIEKDSRFLPMLQILSEASDGRLHVQLGDILEVDLASLPGLLGTTNKVHIVGNLPFNIASPLLIKWLDALSVAASAGAPLPVAGLTLAFQKEVADRLVAGPADGARSRISIMAQTFCDTRLALVIPGGAFVPPPKVDTGVVTLTPRTPPDGVTFDALEAVCRSLFRMRRKTVLNNARSVLGCADSAKAWLDACGVDPELRSQALPLEDFHRLTRHWAQRDLGRMAAAATVAAGQRHPRKHAREEDEDEDGDSFESNDRDQRRSDDTRLKIV